jgi:hypothetical protein
VVSPGPFVPRVRKEQFPFEKCWWDVISGVPLWYSEIAIWAGGAPVADVRRPLVTTDGPVSYSDDAPSSVALPRGNAMMKHMALRSTSMASATLIVVAAAALHTAAQEPARTYPSLPGAVRKPPAWLGNDVPFDLAAFFAAPPPSQNAAPLYLDALFEFGDEMSGCFPPGPETEARRKESLERSQRLTPLLEAFGRDPASVNGAEMAAVIASFQAGFQKLDQAQQRPRCVFETGLSVATLLPHVQTSRQVVRVVSQRALASLDRGDLNAPIADVARALRMARDLQPRGVTITELVYNAEVAALTKQVVTPVLSHPRLRGTQCDRLIKVLIDHEAHALDGYSEALKAEYLMERSTLHDAAGRPGDRDRVAADKAKAAVFESFRLFNLPQNAQQKAKAIAADLPKATPQQYADAVADMNTYYRSLLVAAKLPYGEKQAKAKSAGRATSGTKPSAPVELVRLIREPMNDPAGLIQTLTMAEASLHGLETLAAVRRWQIAHRALPRNLAAACKEAGLKAVPIDPFSGQPMKFVILDGQPVVYSVGKDGKDDGGKLDSKNDTQPGDLIYRLSPVG